MNEKNKMRKRNMKTAIILLGIVFAFIFISMIGLVSAVYIQSYQPNAMVYTQCTVNGFFKPQVSFWSVGKFSCRGLGGSNRYLWQQPWQSVYPLDPWSLCLNYSEEDNSWYLGVFLREYSSTKFFFLGKVSSQEICNDNGILNGQITITGCSGELEESMGFRCSNFCADQTATITLGNGICSPAPTKCPENLGECGVCFCRGYGCSVSSSSGITGMAVESPAPSTPECGCFPEAKFSPVKKDAVEGWECKMCDGEGNTIPDRSKDGQACKYIESGGWFGKDNVLDGKCYNGDCKAGDCYNKLEISGHNSTRIIGSLSDNFEQIVQLKETLKKNVNYDEFKIDTMPCNVPVPFKCPPQEGLNCKVSFDNSNKMKAADVKVSIKPIQTTEEKICSGSMEGSFQANSGNTYDKTGKEAGENLLKDAAKKIEKKIEEFRNNPEVIKTCPSECTITVGLTITNPQATKAYVVNWVNAIANYKIICTGKSKTNEMEVAVDLIFAKYCENA